MAKNDDKAPESAPEKKPEPIDQVSVTRHKVKIGRQEVAELDLVDETQVVVRVDGVRVNQTVQRRAVIAPQAAADLVDRARVEAHPLGEVAIDERVDPVDDPARGRVERVVDVEKKKLRGHEGSQR